MYDSGFGGLSVLRALRETLPNYDFIYLGDSGRAPYGGRNSHTILDFAEQCTERLFAEGCRLIIVACHTVSCVALRHLQRRYTTDNDRYRILGVTIPAAEAAVEISRGHIGVIGTTRTISSGTFRLEIEKLENPANHTHRKVYGHPAPLLAPIVEEGWEGSEIANLAVKKYVSMFPQIDTLVLACTHYPLLISAFRNAIEGNVELLDPSPHVAKKLAQWIDRHPGYTHPGTGSLKILCTGDPSTFRHHGQRFLGTELPAVQHIAEEQGRLASRDRVRVDVGQVVR
ncbi:MAG: aspartate/glutamate racemase family protein [Polyangiaceae bacterium]|nr:aspartate/glutamate racemase family protein [Polyangiaceae bacterium]